MTVPSVPLPDGKHIPQLGFGLWRIRDEGACRAAVHWAAEAGYRHFDTAQIYGNESFLGAALAETGLSRDELFITTKIWNENQFWDDVEPSLEESLRNLRTDYVDLLLIHFPVTETRGPAWRRMEHIFRTGKAKTIGVSNYTIRHLEELLRTCEVKPAVNQVELHVFLQQPELVAFCVENDILIEAYSPLAHGHGLDDPDLAAIAAKHHKTSAQIMIRWCLDRGFVPLSKSITQERIEENLKVFDFALDQEDLEKIAGLERNFRTCWDPTNVP